MKDNSDGTITDEATGLMWQKETLEKMTWDNANAYCRELKLAGHYDWRLPTIQELLSIVDYTRYSPAINTTDFMNTAASWYWSSTTYASSTHYAWLVNFYDGNDSHYGKYYAYYVRAVRRNAKKGE